MTCQQTTRAKVPPGRRGLEDGNWPQRALHFPHHIVHTQEWPDIVIWSDTVAWHQCWIDCTLGGEYGRSLGEEETLLRESTNGIWKQRMGLSSDAHWGSLSWLHWSNNNLIPHQAWTKQQDQTEGHTAANFKKQRKGHPDGSGPKSEKAPHYDKITVLLPPSLPPHTRTISPQPPIIKISLKFACLNIRSNLPGAYKLILTQGFYPMGNTNTSVAGQQQGNLFTITLKIVHSPCTGTTLG